MGSTWYHGVERDAPQHAGGLVAQPRGHPGVRALMHAERKKKQDELEDGDDEGAGLQTNSPRAGKLRLAWRGVEIRPAGWEQSGGPALSKGLCGSNVLRERGTVCGDGWREFLPGLAAGTAGFAQDDEAARANALYQAGKRPEALPLYEDLAKAHPNEQLYFERLADCLGAEAVQLSDPAEIKAVQDAGARCGQARRGAGRYGRICAADGQSRSRYSRSMPASLAPARPCWPRPRKPTRRETFLRPWPSTTAAAAGRPAAIRGAALCGRHGLCAEGSEYRGPVVCAGHCHRSRPRDGLPLLGRRDYEVRQRSGGGQGEVH